MIDVAIVGGGIAGLSMAIECSRAGLKTIVFEKDDYPKHKVCGEYISNESRGYLIELGVSLDQLNLPNINKFKLTTQYGNESNCGLNPGGFGLSRFMLDKLLAESAITSGAIIKTKTKVININGDFDHGFQINTHQNETIEARIVIGAWGRSNALNKAKKLKEKDAWIGVKYHLANGPDSDSIEIHAFNNGYCGISQIEEGKYCLCYLAKASGLKAAQGNISEFERVVLSENPFLAHRLNAKRLEGPITTSQFYFGVNQRLSGQTLLGDASGFIPPLTGNGMSLALRSTKMTYSSVIDLLQNKISFREFEQKASMYQKGYLKRRVSQGILLQDLLFLKPEGLNRVMMSAFSAVPIALKTMTKLAVGKNIQT